MSALQAIPPGTPPGLTPWQPGQSGNPAGFNGLASAVRAALRDPDGDPDGDGRALFATLRAIALNPRARDADRITACRELLDRRYGRAPMLAAVQVDAGAGGAAAVDAAIRDILGELRAGPEDVDGTAARVDEAPQTA